MDKSNLVENMDFNGDHDLCFCDQCVWETPPYPNSIEWGFCAKEILELVDTNLCGPITTPHGREKYLKNFIDDFYKKTFLYAMKIKFCVFDKLKVFKALVEN
jgi:hypothetical protein